MLLDRLNITSPTTLLDKAFGLSLSDQYWIKPFDEELEYKDINFFENDFNDLEFTEATFTTNGPISSNITLLTPNNTTDGVLRKTWVIDKETRYLLKAGFKREVLQPFNEVLASMLCSRLGFSHVPYTIDTSHTNLDNFLFLLLFYNYPFLFCLIYCVRSNKKPYVGMTNFKGDYVTIDDVKIAKSYKNIAILCYL